MVKPFPTHVGVIPQDGQAPQSDLAFPHTRGGDPTARLVAVLAVRFSPHTWG